MPQDPGLPHQRPVASSWRWNVPAIVIGLALLVGIKPLRRLFRRRRR